MDLNVHAVLNQACPTCSAKKDEKCSRPTETGWIKVNWFHEARVSLAEAAVYGKRK